MPNASIRDSYTAADALPSGIEPRKNDVVTDNRPEALPLLRVNGLTKRYGDKTVVDHIDFWVQEGEFISLVGPSGCGKTTTLGMLAGLINPDGGTVRLRDRDITHLNPEDRNVGVVFQNYALFPHMTAEQNVMFPLVMRGVPRSSARQRASDALELVRIAEPGAMVQRLSGGQMQRVALARALVYEPALLLMDEPMSALDRSLRREMQFELRRIQRVTGATVICVTHDQEEAMAMSDRIVVMSHGKVEQAGAPVEVYDRPKTKFVADFMGESNMVEVEAVGRAGDEIVVAPLGASRDFTFAVSSGDPSVSEGWLAVRPERIKLVPRQSRAPESASEAALARNRVEVTVRDVTFLGDRLRVEVTHEDLGKWLVNQHLGADTTGPAPAVGDVMEMTWHASHCAFVAS
jgi:putative spermidine/putrescine transport system ATP-binding protein